MPMVNVSPEFLINAWASLDVRWSTDAEFIDSIKNPSRTPDFAAFPALLTCKITIKII